MKNLLNHPISTALQAMMAFALVLTSLSVDARPKVEKKLKVACVGNSITYGTGIKDRENDAYPSQLQRMLGDAYEVGNFGRPSATLLAHGHMPYFQQAEWNAAKAFTADIAVVHLGINDTDPRNWPNYRDEFVTDYLHLIDTLRQVNPQVRILIARLTPIRHDHHRFTSGTKLWHDEIQEAIETVARVAGVELIDFHAPLYHHPDYSVEGIHPNPAGARLLALTAYSGITGNYGGLHMSPLYTDHMVLQRNQTLDIHGTANAGSIITVTLKDKDAKGTTALRTATGVTDNRGNWTVRLKPLTDTKAEYVLSVDCKDVKATKTNRTNHDEVNDNRYWPGVASWSDQAHPTVVKRLTETIKRKGAPLSRLTFNHVAVGEVWLCSGQSNMGFMLRQSDTGSSDIPKAADNDLRLYNMQWRWDTYAQQWPIEVLDSVDCLEYFKPTYWTPASPESVAQFSAVAYYFGRMLRDSLQVPIGLVCNAVGGSPIESWIDRQTLETRFPSILQNFRWNDFIQPWVRERAQQNVGADGSRLRRHPFMPVYCYEAGILPLAQYPIKGVVWYQGESNAHNFEAHEQLFPLLVSSWRQYWHQPKLPFYYVQLSSLNRPSWPWFRDSQRKLMRLPHTGMVVSTDCGDSLDVHYHHKQPVGERLARWALTRNYGFDLTPSGPLVNQVRSKGDTLVVSFRYGHGLTTSDGQDPRSFEIAHDDGLFRPAKAVIEGNKVMLTAEGVKAPRYVRYAWQPFTRANLVNSDLLPASTFRAKAKTKKHNKHKGQNHKPKSNHHN